VIQFDPVSMQVTVQPDFLAQLLRRTRGPKQWKLEISDGLVADPLLRQE
jgi:hypothetical protein